MEVRELIPGRQGAEDFARDADRGLAIHLDDPEDSRGVVVEAERGLAAGTDAARARYARAMHELEVAERRAHRLSLESRWRSRSWGTARN